MVDCLLEFFERESAFCVLDGALDCGVLGDVGGSGGDGLVLSAVAQKV